jgi:hypothetical protein
MTGLTIESFFIALTLLSYISFPLSIWAIVEVLAFKRSTHKVQFLNPLANSLAGLANDGLDAKETEGINKINAQSVDPDYRHIDRFWSGT